jgi:GGDEF domain-containing protein
MAAMWRARRGRDPVTEVEERSPAAAGRTAHVHDASHDLLTGVANGAVLRLRLDDAVATGRATAVLACTVDGIDHLGEGTRGLVLREIASRLAASARPGDLVARTAVDEFAVLVDGDRFDADEVAQRALDLVEEPFVVGGELLRPAVPVTFSGGIAQVLPGDGRDPFDDARSAMAAIRTAGGGVRHAVPTDVMAPSQP